MKRKKRRDSSPTQRVRCAKAAADKSVDFDYEETTDVLRAALDEITNDAVAQQERIEKVATTLKRISVRAPAPAPTPTENVG